MNKFFNTCRRCLSPWMIGVVLVIIVGLIYFIPILGVATLVVVLPLIACTVMCGGMAFMMMKSPKEK